MPGFSNSFENEPVKLDFTIAIHVFFVPSNNMGMVYSHDYLVLDARKYLP